MLILAALSFSIVLLLMGYSFYKAASKEVLSKRKREKTQQKAV